MQASPWTIIFVLYPTKSIHSVGHLQLDDQKYKINAQDLCWAINETLFDYWPPQHNHDNAYNNIIIIVEIHTDKAEHTHTHKK